jgi:hypothetical protein
MDSIWLALVIGLIAGGLLSTVFGIYNKQTAGQAVRSLFGLNSNTWITDALIMLVAASFVFLSTVSAINRDLTYPVKSPMYFTLETLMMALFPSVVLFAMTVFRGYRINASTYQDFFLLVLKFGLLHVLLQFSGFYSYIFPPK